MCVVIPLFNRYARTASDFFITHLICRFCFHNCREVILWLSLFLLICFQLSCAGLFPHTDRQKQIFLPTVVETKPAPHDASQRYKAFRTAGVYFLPDSYEDANMKERSTDINVDIDYTQMCQKEGYNITFCELPSYVSFPCPYDSKIYRECLEDRPRACREAGYTDSCDSSQQLGDTDRCPWDDSFGKCCNRCDGYEYTVETIPQGYIADGAPCLSCQGNKYRIKINPCEGFVECDLGGAAGAAECVSGTVKKYASCKACPAGCSASCPENADCFQCDGKYCISSCREGFMSFENYYCNQALMCLIPKD